MLTKTISTSLLLATLILFSACVSGSTNKTPKCSDLAVMDRLSEILSTDAIKATVDIQSVKKQLDLRDQNGKRTCYARVDYLNGVDGMIENDKILFTVTPIETEEKYIVNIIEK